MQINMSSILSDQLSDQGEADLCHQLVRHMLWSWQWTHTHTHHHYCVIPIERLAWDLMVVVVKLQYDQDLIKWETHWDDDTFTIHVIGFLPPPAWQVSWPMSWPYSRCLNSRSSPSPPPEAIRKPMPRVVVVEVALPCRLSTIWLCQEHNNS